LFSPTARKSKYAVCITLRFAPPSPNLKNINNEEHNRTIPWPSCTPSRTLTVPFLIKYYLPRRDAVWVVDIFTDVSDVSFASIINFSFSLLVPFKRIYIIYTFLAFPIQVTYSASHNSNKSTNQMQPIYPVYYLTFMYSSTCFGRPHAHHQELNNCSSSLWFYRWSVVVAVLLVVVKLAGRPAHPGPTALLTPRSNGKTRGCYCSYWAPDGGCEDTRNMLSRM
jgi:hypothetical protein